MVVLDDAGEVLRPAKLWNDTESAPDAAALVEAAAGCSRPGRPPVGSVPVASFTITKLAWLHRSRAARRSPPGARVMLPHDWLTHRLTGERSPPTAATPRARAGGRRSEGDYRPGPPRGCRQATATVARDAPRGSLGPTEVAGEWGGIVVRVPGDRRQHGVRRWAWASASGTRGAEPRHQRHRLRRVRPADRRPLRRGRRVRRRHRPLPAAGVHAQRHEGHRLPSPGCSASATTGSTRWHLPRPAVPVA
jgi:hypothetical protein